MTLGAGDNTRYGAKEQEITDTGWEKRVVV
jgi:hypothetical protein